MLNYYGHQQQSEFGAKDDPGKYDDTDGLEASSPLRVWVRGGGNEDRC